MDRKRIAEQLVEIAKEILEDEILGNEPKHKKTAKMPAKVDRKEIDRLPVVTGDDEIEVEIDKVIIRVVPWNTKEAATINVMKGGKPHYSLARVKNLLDRKVPSFDYNGNTQQEKDALKEEVEKCFGNEQNLIDKLKDLEHTGTFYAQVDNFKPFCDAYHIKNDNGVEMYVKFYCEINERSKSDFVIIVRCHKDREK